MGRLTKIEAKPEQSKHLETATARVFDLSLDWVQQRGQEVYTEGSRIPTVVRLFRPYPPLDPLLTRDPVTQAFGTPLEDAERRDLTINSLFYNLRTRAIEDQTDKGLSDLGFVPGQPRKIRTPLEPVKTFHDDPLRVVRAVRFAARFGREYELDREMEDAIKREEIKVRFDHGLSSKSRLTCLVLSVGGAAQSAQDQPRACRSRARQDAPWCVAPGAGSPVSPFLTSLPCRPGSLLRL